MKQLSLSQKMSLIVAILCAGIVGVAGVGLYNLNRVGDVVSNVTDVQFKSVVVSSVGRDTRLDGDKATRKSAEDGEKKIQGLLEAMKVIDLDSKKIQEITSVVDDLAFQTNLLQCRAYSGRI